MSPIPVRRIPSIQRAVGGLVVGLFGILWSLVAWHLLETNPLPYLGIVLPLVGVLVTVTSWSQSAYHFVHLARQQQFAESDFLSFDEAKAPRHNLAPACLRCRAELQPTFRYCPQCGTKVC